VKTIKDIILRAFEQKKRRGYEHIFWAIDLHDTVIEGRYNRYNVGAGIYPYAKEVLHYLYNSKTHRTILWTSSHDDSINDILVKHQLNFHYINRNPECPSDKLCNFDDKFYFNILLDDKSGFDPITDWLVIKETLEELGEMK